MRGALPDRYELGILFVHGIGEQKRGQTLTEMGEPLADWLRRWIAGPDTELDTVAASEPNARDTPVEVLDATIVPADPGDPSSVILRVAAGGVSQRWLVAESWWAEVFLPAKFSQLATWGLLVGPVVLASHVSLILQRLLGTVDAVSRKVESGFLGSVAINGVWALGGIAFMFVAVIAAIIAFVFEVLAIILLIVAIVPIPWIRGFLLSIQRGLANGLGDSYVLAQSPFQFTAMVGRVLRDSRWLSDKADKVIVVAHSQGAAVAYEAMRSSRERPRGVRLLITFGQGLRKLRNLAALSRTSILTWAGRGFWLLFGISSAGLLLLGVSAIGIACRALRCGGDPLPRDSSVWEAILAEAISVWGLIGLVAFIAVIASQLVIMLRAQAGEERLEEALLTEFRGIGLKRDEFEWLDLYASADPVPNGSLLGRQRQLGGFQSIRVRNLSSTVSDHTTYWRNHLDFVTKVAIAIGNVANLRLDGLRDGDAARLEAGRALRARRVALLTGYRIVALLGWLSILSSLGRSLPVVGARLAEPLPETLPLIGDIASLPSFVFGVFASAAIGLVIYVWYLLSRISWGWGMASDERRFFERDDPAVYWTSTPHALGLLLMGFGLGAIAATIAGITHELWFVALFLLLVGAAWLVTTVFPRVAEEEGMGNFVAVSGTEAILVETPGSG